MNLLRIVLSIPFLVAITLLASCAPRNKNNLRSISTCAVQRLPDVPLVLNGVGGVDLDGVEYFTISGGPEMVSSEDPILRVAHVCLTFDPSLHAQRTSGTSGNTPDKFVWHGSNSYLINGERVSLEIEIDGREHTFHFRNRVFNLADGNFFRIRVPRNLDISIEQLPVLEIYNDDPEEIRRVFNE